ncbi:MAG: hypothetical protein HQL69_09365 [Magnetococcales bacterium]|nr:hypothetical protein [Magnetococcales bacterium]
MLETSSEFRVIMFEYFSYVSIGIIFFGLLALGLVRLIKNSKNADRENNSTLEKIGEPWGEFGVNNGNDIESTPKPTEQDRVASPKYKANYLKYKAILKTDDMLEFKGNYGYIPYKNLPDPGRGNYRSIISTAQLAKLYVMFELAYKHYGHNWPNHTPPYDSELDIKDNGFFYNCRCCGAELIDPEILTLDGYIYCDYSCYGRGKDIAGRTGAR